MLNKLTMTFLIIIFFAYTTIDVRATAFEDLKNMAGSDGNIPVAPPPTCVESYDYEGNLIPCPDVVPDVPDDTNYNSNPNNYPEKDETETDVSDETIVNPVVNPITSNKDSETGENGQKESERAYEENLPDPDCANAIFDGSKAPEKCKKSNDGNENPISNENPKPSFITTSKNKLLETVAWLKQHIFPPAKPRIPDVPRTPDVKTQTTITQEIVKSFVKPTVSIEYGYGINANKSSISSHTFEVMGKILDNAKLNHAVIMSSYRSPADQARVMFEDIRNRRNAYISNAKAQGDYDVREDEAEAYARMSARKVYCKRPTSPGCDVLLAYETDYDNKFSDVDTKADMESIIASYIEEGVYISPHQRDPKLENAIDIAPSSFTKEDKIAFIKAFKQAEKDGLIRDFKQPPDDLAFHFVVDNRNN